MHPHFHQVCNPRINISHRVDDSWQLIGSTGCRPPHASSSLPAMHLDVAQGLVQGPSVNALPRWACILLCMHITPCLCSASQRLFARASRSVPTHPGWPLTESCFGTCRLRRTFASCALASAATRASLATRVRAVHGRFPIPMSLTWFPPAVDITHSHHHCLRCPRWCLTHPLRLSPCLSL